MQTRIAPTPSGYLHLGNAWSFVLTWLIAKSQGATLFLRIDDLDQERYRKEYLEDVFESLHWLGIQWDHGPKDSQEFLNQYSQTKRYTHYWNTLKELIYRHQVYQCNCSRKKIRDYWKQQSIEHKGYPGFCRVHTNFLSLENSEEAWERLMQSSGFAWRIYFSEDYLQKEAENDIVVRLKDGKPSYHLSSVVDDVLYQNDLIVRGRDLQNSTYAQIQLSQAMNEFRKKDNFSFSNSTFFHHSLILEDTEHKLSKSEGSTSLKYLRGHGVSADRALRAFARLLGNHNFQGTTIQELYSCFNIESIPKQDIQIKDLMNLIATV